MPRLNSKHEQQYNVPLAYLPTKSFNIFLDFYQLKEGYCQFCAVCLLYLMQILEFLTLFSSVLAFNRFKGAQDIRHFVIKLYHSCPQENVWPWKNYPKIRTQNTLYHEVQNTNGTKYLYQIDTILPDNKNQSFAQLYIKTDVTSPLQAMYQVHMVYKHFVRLNYLHKKWLCQGLLIFSSPGCRNLTCTILA